MEMTAVCLGKLAKTASFPHSHSFGDDLEFPFSPARLTSTSTKSVTYMPGTFCYRHARSHKGEPMRALAPEVRVSWPAPNLPEPKKAQGLEARTFVGPLRPD